MFSQPGLCCSFWSKTEKYKHKISRISLLEHTRRQLCRHEEVVWSGDALVSLHFLQCAHQHVSFASFATSLRTRLRSYFARHTV